MQNRLRHVKITWGKPILLENIANSKNYGEEQGFYLISRKYVRHGKVWERYIYIGETCRGFAVRFKEHIKKNSFWLKGLIGKKYIRFGKIEHMPQLDESEDYLCLKHFNLTVESALIYAIKFDPRVELVNGRQIKKFKLWYHLRIENIDKRGVLPPIINTREIAEETGNAIDLLPIEISDNRMSL